MKVENSQETALLSYPVSGLMEDSAWLVFLSAAHRISSDKSSIERESRKARRHIEAVGQYIVGRCDDVERARATIYASGTKDALVTAEITATVLKERYKMQAYFVDLSQNIKVVSDRQVDASIVNFVSRASVEDDSATIFVGGKSSIGSFTTAAAYVDNYAEAVVIERHRIVPVTSGYEY